MKISVGWQPDATLEQEINDQFESALAAYQAKPTLIAEHSNHEESIRTGGYATRTLLELVQNAADQMSGAENVSDDPGRVEIILDQTTSTLYCANSGRPFSQKGIIAITHAHLSAKRGDEIGRFGLGFKSVLAVTETPQIFSRSVSFEFNSEQSRRSIRNIGVPARRLPILRTPTLVDANEHFEQDPVLQDLAEWATTVVRLPNIHDTERIRREMLSFSSEFLLFVSGVREVRLSIVGDEEFTTSHISRVLGGGHFKIERPDGTGEEWFVGERMHSPSADARREVGEAVSRDKIKVSVAVPLKPRKANAETGDTGTAVGQFWSYFPLQDRTSATAFFNAPWSVNDDRTTLLRNQYNREILSTVAEIFVDVVVRLSTREDPALHFDYLPARGKEATYFGDEVLCALVPSLAVRKAIIPDGDGTLVLPSDLRPLDPGCEWKIPEEAHQGWVISPNTGIDVPHWRCYASNQRMARLRQLFAVSVDPNRYEEDKRDFKRALESIPKRGILTWLREWAEGKDYKSAGNAFKVVLANIRQEFARSAKVIPTTDGLRSLDDRNQVFLAKLDDLIIEGAVFVEEEFLALQGMENTLRELKFRDLDPVAVLNARLDMLTRDDTIEMQQKFWDAAEAVSISEASKVISGNQTAKVLVPTRDGGWHWPQQVIDVEEKLDAKSASLLLDYDRCIPRIAHLLGVAWDPLEEFSYEDEFFASEYERWVREELNSRLTVGERPIENIALYPTRSKTQGPFSVLLMLKEADAPAPTRERWTRRLLEFGDSPWDCEDTATGVSYRVKSPVRWAVENAGVLKSSLGYRPATELVASILTPYSDLLPVWDGARIIAETLGLPDELESVPTKILQKSLDTEILPGNFGDEKLAEFILNVTQIAYSDGTKPPKVPARVVRIFESRTTQNVYVATDEEQRNYLRDRHLPYLFASKETGQQLVNRVGCTAFEDSFTFSVSIDGRRDPEPAIDVFTGLRGRRGSRDLQNINVVRADTIEKWVQTPTGIDSQRLNSHHEGNNLFVAANLSDREILKLLSDEFDLSLNNADIDAVLQSGLDHRLELLRLEAVAQHNDADRLDVYFGEDDLKDKLPKGLWRGLESQGLITRETSVAELFLSVYGKDTIRELADLFTREGFPDVPNQWAGGPSTKSWLRKMGFGDEFAGQRSERQVSEFIVPGASILPGMHDYQARISAEMRDVILEVDQDDRRAKAMVELPTGAGKTRIATQTLLQMFINGDIQGSVLWIAQSQELCEQAVQTFAAVWRGLCTDQRVDMPITIGRLWDSNEVHVPDTEHSVIVATDAKLDSIRAKAEYDWLTEVSVVLIDEGHVAGASTRYTRLLSWLGVDGHNWKRPLIGLSATPFKGTSVQATEQLVRRFGQRKISPFHKDQNPYQELVARGVLARVKHEILDGAKVTLSAEESSEATQMKRVSGTVMDKVAADHGRMGTLINSIMNLPPERKKSVLVFTPNILSAQVLAATLRFRGINAASVSGRTGRQERREVIDRFKNDEIQVLTNCDLLTQGFDAPGVTALYIARPTFSPNAYIQMAGRGLRGPKNGGKEECLIVDIADNFGSSDINNLLGFHGYEDLWKEQNS